MLLKPPHLDDCRARLPLARAALRAAPHELYGPLMGYLAMALDDLAGLRAAVVGIRDMAQHDIARGIPDDSALYQIEADAHAALGEEPTP